MRVLSEDGSRQWMERHGYELPPGEGRYPPGARRETVFPIPDMTRDQLVLAYYLAEWLGDAETLLWMTTWSGFSEQQMRTFLAIRRRVGDSRQLIEARGHLFAEGDPDNTRTLTELFYYLMGFNFEAQVYRADRKCFVWMWDYEIMVITEDGEMRRALRRLRKETPVNSIERKLPR